MVLFKGFTKTFKHQSYIVKIIAVDIVFSVYVYYLLKLIDSLCSVRLYFSWSHWPFSIFL